MKQGKGPRVVTGGEGASGAAFLSRRWREGGAMWCLGDKHSRQREQPVQWP